MKIGRNEKNSDSPRRRNYRKNTGRPRRGRYQKITTTLAIKDFNLIDKEATRLGVTRSEIIERCLREFFSSPVEIAGSALRVKINLIKRIVDGELGPEKERRLLEHLEKGKKTSCQKRI